MRRLGIGGGKAVLELREKRRIGQRKPAALHAGQPKCRGGNIPAGQADELRELLQQSLEQLLADEAKLPLEVAKLQLSRTDFSNSQPGAEHIKALKAAAPILLDEQLVRPGTDVAQVVDKLIQPQLAAQVIGSNVAKAGN